MGERTAKSRTLNSMKHKKSIPLVLTALVCGASFFGAFPAWAQDAPRTANSAGKQGTNNWDYTAPDGGVPKDLALKVGVDQKLDAQVPLELQFRDETGKTVRLGDYFGSKPVMITMLQMTCDQVCSAQLGAMTSALNQVPFSVGKEFDVLNISIDPHEGPLIAKDAKDELLKNYKRPSAPKGWHFLTYVPGQEKNIKTLAAALGIRYMYHEPTKQYIHPNGLVLVTPDAKVSRYFLSLAYQPRDMKFSIMEASKDKIGTFTDQIALSCFHYNPNTGKYSFQIMAFLRVVGLAFVAGSLLAIAAMVSLERKRNRTTTGGSSPQLKKA